MFNKSTLLVAAFATHQSQAAPPVHDKWQLQDAFMCKFQLSSMRRQNPSLTYMQSQEPDQCWSYLDIYEMNQHFWFEFQKSSYESSFAYIVSPLGSDGEPYLQCFKWTSQEDFNFQCAEKRPKAEPEVDVHEISRPQFYPETTPAKEHVSSDEPSSSEDGWDGLDKQTQLLVVLGSVAIILVLCFCMGRYLNQREKQTAAYNTRRRQEEVQNRQNEAAAARAATRQARATVVGAVVAEDAAGAQQNNQVIIGDIIPGKNQSVYLAEDVNRRHTVENNQYGSLVVKKDLVISFPAENTDEEKLGAARANRMSECPAIHEAIGTGQQQFEVMAPSEHDESEPTDLV